MASQSTEDKAANAVAIDGDIEMVDLDQQSTDVSAAMIDQQSTGVSAAMVDQQTTDVSMAMVDQQPTDASAEQAPQPESNPSDESAIKPHTIKLRIARRQYDASIWYHTVLKAGYQGSDFMASHTNWVNLEYSKANQVYPSEAYRLTFNLGSYQAEYVYDKTTNRLKLIHMNDDMAGIYKEDPMTFLFPDLKDDNGNRLLYFSMEAPKSVAHLGDVQGWAKLGEGKDVEVGEWDWAKVENGKWWQVEKDDAQTKAFRLSDGEKKQLGWGLTTKDGKKLWLDGVLEIMKRVNREEADIAKAELADAVQNGGQGSLKDKLDKMFLDAAGSAGSTLKNDEHAKTGNDAGTVEKEKTPV